MSISLTRAQTRMIDRWLSAVETGVPGGDYSNVTRLFDGPGGRRQVTYGKHQTTEAGRNVQKLVKQYLGHPERKKLTQAVDAKLRAFVDAPAYSMANDAALVRALQTVGQDPVMQALQDEFFLRVYMQPAMKWAEDNGFVEPLSLLVIYDSFIQSGGIRMDLRRRFSEVPPSKGGREKVWIDSYVDVRHQWLRYWGDGKTLKSKNIRTSSYRTAALMREIESGNWKLNKPMGRVNGIDPN